MQFMNENDRPKMIRKKYKKQTKTITVEMTMPASSLNV